MNEKQWTAPMNRYLRLVVAACVALAAGVAGIVVPASASADALSTQPPGVQARADTTVTSDALPTVQIDSGVVWSQAIVGDTVYAGGSFSNARPAGAAAGTNLTPRTNLLAYSLSTGNLVTSFAPSINGVVDVVRASPDGSRIYVGGSFTTVNGTSHYNLAAFSTATGQLITTFKAQVGGSYVNAIAATNSSVYVGGLIGAGDGTTRKNLAAFDLNGKLLGWAPTTDLQVDSMVIPTPADKLVIAGRFSTVNGLPQRGMAALSLNDGSALPWAANATVQNGTSAGKAGIYSVSADGSSVYGTGWVYSDVNSGNLEGSFSADSSTGTIKWLEDCHGDTYDSYSDGTTVYTVSHNHDCSGVGAYPQKDPAPGNVRHAQAWTASAQGTLTRTDEVSSIYKDWSGQPAPAMLNWYPDFVTGSFTGQGQAAWDITGNGTYVVAGGEFPSVNGTTQQGLVRFARKSVSGAKDAPRLAGNRWLAAAVSVASGRVRVSIPQNYDRDSLSLTYQLRRTGTTDPIYSTTLNSPFWTTQPISFTDTKVTGGQSYTYQWTAVDGDGNSVKSNPVTITASSATLSNYAQDVLGDGASHYWRLGETSGATGYDYAGADDLVENAGVTHGATGAVGDSDGSSTFNGQSTGFAVDPNQIAGPNSFTEEAWFRTTSTTGGKIVSFGNQSTGNSGSYDRHIYMDAQGRIWFGVYNNNSYTINTSASFNDGKWHYVSSSLSPAGMVLYVDGKRIGTNTGTTVGQTYNGYWRVGGDSPWTDSGYFQGDIDDVAIYPSALTLTQVQNHFQDSGRSLNLPSAPTDRYGKAVFQDSPDLYFRTDDASGPTAVDSSVNAAPGVYSGGVTYGVSSPVTGVGGTGVTFNGSNGTLSSSTSYQNPTAYTEELWFKTTTTNGGKLIGFGDKQSGQSGNYDRHVFMNADGTLTFGTWTGQENLARSTLPYNDGQWHYMVATQGSSGMVLYVDGAQVATNPQTSAQSYTGYWRIGGDTAWDGVQPWFSGSIDEVSVYLTALTPAQVLAHYKASYAAGNAKPTASFTTSTTNLDAAFDASASSDSDGTIASYAWDFGDGTTATGVSPVHHYTAAGTYTVNLTVTDDGGATATASHTVVATAKPNTAPTAVIGVDVDGLKATFSGTGSSDTDGQVVSYAWDFGDGTTSTSASPVHTYTGAGSYTVSLTVTDDQGSTGSAQRAVTVAVPNTAPMAQFTSSSASLAASFDGSASSDSDGTVAGYAWNFGDNSAVGSGATPSHTYASAGTYQVTLVVTDDKGATDSVTHAVTVTAANQPPAAAFSSSIAGLKVSVDGSLSTDADGTVAGYQWDFGDNTAAGSGVTTSHTYTAAGTYTVTLTVTDDDGAKSSVTHQVTVATAVVYAADTFGRTSATGLGNAETGGAWTTTGSASLYSVNGSVGKIAMKTAGSSPAAVLNGVSASDVQATVDVSFDSVPTGGGSWAYLLVRQSSAGNYQLAVKVLAASTTVYLRKLVGSTTTTLATKVLTMNYAAGDQLRLAALTTGSSPTSLSGKVWKVGQTEPSGYQVTATDGESALQAAGHVGVQTYLSGSATILPVTASVDNFDARRPAGAGN